MIWPSAGTLGLEGTIEIAPGDRIPLVPQHMAKAFADIHATSKMSVDVSLTAFSGSLARGNENGLHVPDGTFYLGPGSTPAYAIGESRRAVSGHSVGAALLQREQSLQCPLLHGSAARSDGILPRTAISSPVRFPPSAAIFRCSMPRFTRPARRSGPGRGCASSSRATWATVTIFERVDRWAMG